MTTSLLAPTRTHAPYPKTPRQAEFIDLGARMAEIASQNSRQHDRDGTFPSDTFLALRNSGFLGLTLPLDEGGHGADPIETMLALEQLARGDGAVGLATTMHLVVIAGLADNRLWPEALLEAFFEEVAGDGALINGLASEPDLGSPSRGGLFATTAEAVVGGWKLNGRKTWSTLSPALTYGIVSASVAQPDGTKAPGQFLVAMDSTGVRIEETWDNLSMRSTGSHDVILDNVFVPADRQLPKPVGRPGSAVNPWALLTSAVYLGIGTAARDFAVQFAKDRVPSGLGSPIAELQTVQHRVAQMDIQLLQARTVLYQTVETFLAMPQEDRAAMAWQFAAAKYTVTNNMITVTDQALRIVGSAGLQRKFPLERYFRDVRAGLGNPPMDDVALTLIGKFALDVS